MIIQGSLCIVCYTYTIIILANVAAITGRLVNAWYDTPTKWYPLHIGVGSLLLVSLHWRKRRQQALEDAETAQGEQHSVRIKGPWQVNQF